MTAPVASISNVVAFKSTESAAPTPTFKPVPSILIVVPSISTNPTEFRMRFPEVAVDSVKLPPVTVKFEAAVPSNDIPEVLPASIVMLSPESISTIPAELIRTPPDVVVESVRFAPVTLYVELAVPSIFTVAPFKSILPVVVKSISWLEPAMFTPPAPSRVKAPVEVEKLDAAPASILVAPTESIVIVESESMSCGPPLALIEPLKNKLFHL